VLLSVVLLAFAYGAGVAEERGGVSGGTGFVVSGSAVYAADEYTQDFLVEDEGAGCALSGPKFDRYGVYYFVKRNAAGTSEILRNYSDTNKTSLTTIPGSVELWDVTPEGDYVYYTLSGEEGRLYRLPLKDDGPLESGAFQIEGEKFLFNSLVLAKTSDEFFLMSPLDSNQATTIGLFSFDGSPEPSKTWNAKLPADWRGDYTSDSEGRAPGYGIEFEATTDRIWLLANTRYERATGSWKNLPRWFFSAKITAPGPLTEYDPATEFGSDWNTGSFKYLTVSRYSRNITELADSTPYSSLQSIREYDPVAQTPKGFSLTEWTNAEGKPAPISDWLSGGDSGDWEWYFLIDAQGNFYAVCKRYPSGGSTWNATFQRFARFTSPAGETAETPEPDQSLKDNPTFNDPSKVVLKASDFKGPDGYEVISSRWRVFKKSASSDGMSTMAVNVPVCEETQISAPFNIHTLLKILPDGEYEWQMAYDCIYSRPSETDETQNKSTNWSQLASFVVEKVASGGGKSGGGGCDSIGLGLGILVLAVAAAGKGVKKGR
jgi:hypothetical protein